MEIAVVGAGIFLMYLFKKNQPVKMETSVQTPASVVEPSVEIPGPVVEAPIAGVEAPIGPVVESSVDTSDSGAGVTPVSAIIDDQVEEKTA